ncbi:MAG: hypothetical protein US58_C0040G0001, partial [Candidatus Magasanikbacteria bacterium GW2011_GWA2_37_8]
YYYYLLIYYIIYLYLLFKINFFQLPKLGLKLGGGGEGRFGELIGDFSFFTNCLQY